MSRLISGILVVLLLLGLAGCGQNREIEAVDSTREISEPAYESSFVSEADFYRCLAQKEAEKLNTLEIEGRIMGAVVPHHLLAGHLTARLMEGVAKSRPQIVILVAPNHSNSGAKIITGSYDWRTPSGIVKTDRQDVRKLERLGLAVIDEEIMSREHSVGAVVPFIRYYLPEASVLPLVLHHDVSLQEVDALLTALETMLDNKEYIVLGSVDFSHYLSRQEAQKKDQVTLQAMRGLDYKAIYAMDNDHLDSPAALSMVLRAAERRGISEFQVLDNTNSGLILHNDLIETTSYFTLLFEEEK